MKYLLSITLLLGAVFLFSSCATQSIAEEPPPFDGPAPEVALEEAAEHFKKRVDLESAKKAIASLQKARNPEKRNFEVEWKFARYSYFLGSRKSIPESEAEEYLKKGLSAARIAQRMKPKDPAGHMWYAAILGEQSKRSPVTVGVASIDKVRKALNKVIELDPGYQAGSAYDGLGQLEMGTRGLAGGSVEKAIEFFEKGIEISDDNSYLKLHLAEAYLATGKKAEARKLLDVIIKEEPDKEFLAEQLETQADAKKLLEKKF